MKPKHLEKNFRAATRHLRFARAFHDPADYEKAAVWAFTAEDTVLSSQALGELAEREGFASNALAAKIAVDSLAHVRLHDILRYMKSSPVFRRARKIVALRSRKVHPAEARLLREAVALESQSVLARYVTPPRAHALATVLGENWGVTLQGLGII
ncbi:MAG: hypothetical protein V1708_04815 [Candidatus Micrarchaeota archaeon]